MKVPGDVVGCRNSAAAPPVGRRSHWSGPPRVVGMGAAMNDITILGRSPVAWLPSSSQRIAVTGRQKAWCHLDSEHRDRGSSDSAMLANCQTVAPAATGRVEESRVAGCSPAPARDLAQHPIPVGAAAGPQKRAMSLTPNPGPRGTSALPTSITSLCCGVGRALQVEQLAGTDAELRLALQHERQHQSPAGRWRARCIAAAWCS